MVMGLGKRNMKNMFPQYFGRMTENNQGMKTNAFVGKLHIVWLFSRFHPFSAYHDLEEEKPVYDHLFEWTLTIAKIQSYRKCGLAGAETLIF